MRITREELYKQIWNEPLTKLAQHYDVSSSYLARVCEGLNVPHPPRGSAVYHRSLATWSNMNTLYAPPARLSRASAIWTTHKKTFIRLLSLPSVASMPDSSVAGQT